MDPYEVLASLGPVAVYRHPDVIREHWAQVEAARAEFRRRFDACETDRERLLMAIDVSSQLINMARERACHCQMQSATLACENIDINAVAADWVEFVRKRINGDA